MAIEAADIDQYTDLEDDTRAVLYAELKVEEYRETPQCPKCQRTYDVHGPVISGRYNKDLLSFPHSYNPSQLLSGDIRDSWSDFARSITRRYIHKDTNCELAFVGSARKTARIGPYSFFHKFSHSGYIAGRSLGFSSGQIQYGFIPADAQNYRTAAVWRHTEKGEANPDLEKMKQLYQSNRRPRETHFNVSISRKLPVVWIAQIEEELSEETVQFINHIHDRVTTRPQSRYCHIAANLTKGFILV